MKTRNKIFRWIGIAVTTPFLLFIILAALLYVPPVQNWAVRKVAAIASEKTGMEITVGHVNLEWPINLGLDNFQAIKPNDSLPQLRDTIADVKHLTVDVQLRPLFHKRVVINELSMTDARINTDGFISDLRVKGELQELWLSSKGIDLDKETVEVNGARLSEARLDIALSDTAAVDTTETVLKWRINADSLSIHHTDIAVHLPGDSLFIQAYMGHAVARGSNIDLGANIYQVESLDWHDGLLAYHNRKQPVSDGFDYNHVELSNIRLGIDSISYTPAGTSLYIRQTSMREKSGIEVNDITGRVLSDYGFNNIQLPGMKLRTPDSDIEAEASLSLSPDSGDISHLKLRLNAQLGKPDLMRFMGSMPQKFVERYPNHPLTIKGSLNGNMQQLDFTGLDLSLPTALHLTANGQACNLTDMKNLRADIKLDAQAQDISFITALLDPKVMNDYRLPNNMALNGTLHADGTHYAADLTAREGAGSVKMKGNATVPLNDKGELVTDAISYDADISVKNLNLHHFMPKDSIYTLTADVKARGHGTNILLSSSRLKADVALHQLQYGHWDLNDINATADLTNGRGLFSVIGHNQLFDGTVNADALLSTKQLEATITTNIDKADFYRMRLVGNELAIGMSGTIDVKSDMKQSHQLRAVLSNLYIKDEKQTFHPEKVGLYLQTSPDTTWLRAQSGDFIVKLDASGGYERLMNQGSTLMDSLRAQYNNKVINQPLIKQMLPTLHLYVESQQSNPVADLLRIKDISFRRLHVDLTTSPETGINGYAYLHSLNYDSTRIDTINLHLTQKGDRLTYQGQVCNNRKNPQFVFNALLDGHVTESGGLVGLRYYDEQGRLGIRLGASAAMEQGGIRFKLLPEKPTVGYKVFTLNADNYVFLGSNNRIQAKVDLIADDKTGMKIYTEHQDSTMLQDLTVSVNRFDLGRLTSVMPYLPRITGHLDGDFHILQDQSQKFSVASDMSVRQMTYEGSPIGNLSTELVYLQREDDAHAVEARLMLDDEEFGLLSGSYQKEHIDATFTMTRLPLSLVNGFVPDQLLGLEGYGEGMLTIKGSTRHPQVDGEIYVDSAYLVSQPYGVRMRFDNDPVRIVGSHLLLENFGLYAYNEEPLIMMGDINFSDTEHVTMDMRMRARNLLLINSKQTAHSVAFGKAFVNFFARMQGPLEQLAMRGKLDVLGSTDMTYMLLDSPLSTDNRLDELVKFTDFSDSTQTVVTRPVPSGFNMDMTVSVSQGAHIICDLNAEQTNYVDLMGGGDLRMRYNQDGLSLTGRYTLSNGEMKYSLPIIPLKTFTIKDGSYVEFTGDPMNPRLNITATERTYSNVTVDEQSRNVMFDCGVVITKTLNDMGLQFIIEAPEDMSVNSELQAMSVEERGKLAVTMLTTGMYLADGNTSAFSMNSALSSFLENEINNITGSTLKGINLNVGVDNMTSASGATRTDYSFRFSKRLWNNRLNIQLGGKVSTGDDDMANGAKESFFDNVTMEYRLDQSGQKNIKLFYKQNVYDWLDGYTGVYGGGFVWRRKLDHLWDVFKMSDSSPAPREMTPTRRLQKTATDTLKNDTIKKGDIAP